MSHPVLTFLCVVCAKPVPLPAGSPTVAMRCPDCDHVYATDGGIVVLNSASNPDDYPDRAYALLADAEPRHFWFGERNRLILSTMRRAIGPLRGRRVLDVGCGTGFVTAALERAGMTACGLDMNLAGLRYARERMRGPLLRDDAGRLPFGAQFDVVMLCDVIEHTPNDVAVLREASRTLREAGSVVVTVPAHPGLWTAIDDASGHKRRYTRSTLARAVEGAGFRLRLVRYFNTLLYPAQVIQRLTLKRAPVGSDADRMRLVRRTLRVPPRPLNSVLRLAARADIPLGRLRIPFGTSLIAVGARP